MSVAVTKSSDVVSAAAPISLSQLFGVTASSSNPAYLVLSGLDRNEYTAGATGATGTLSGNGNTDAFSSIGSDGRGVGIVFTYQASTGQYYNSTYGYLNQITYTASSSLNDVTNLSLFGTGNLSLATQYANNPYAMMQMDPSGYIGSATIATQPGFPGTVPSQATPGSIAAVAETFVGKAWNMNGCWVLASTIAADAGTSLPVQSTAIGQAGQANGEWIVAYNGPAGQSANWQSMVTAGEIVVIGTSGGGGHITTCVSGSGSTAMLVDNVTYVNSAGQVQNLAKDGSSSDILVATPHLASQEWSGVAASSVVIYELDTPIVADLVSSASLASGKTCSLSSLFSAKDPGTRAITGYQVYDTAASDTLLVNGSAASAHTAASAVTAGSLSSVLLDAGVTACTDTVDVRAFNGSYWGDWQTISVSVSAAAPAPAPAPAPTIKAPVLAAQTPNQTWLQGSRVSFTVPTATFADPQGQKLAYSAKQASGQALPSWLTFNAATDTFSGAVPSVMQTLSLAVTATDTSGLSVSETFQASVPAAPPVAARQTASQTVSGGQAFSMAIPSGTFTDPQGQALNFTATQSNGQALPSWLKFNGATDTFSGTAPITQQSLGIKLTATDTSGLSASESFSLGVTQPAPVLAIQTPNQTWTESQQMSFIMPANTFSDGNSGPMTYTAWQVSGPNVTSWLFFNAQNDTFSGKVPASVSGPVGIEVIATNASHMSASDSFSVAFAAPGGHLSVAGATQVAPPMLAAAFHC